MLPPPRLLLSALQCHARLPFFRHPEGAERPPLASAASGLRYLPVAGLLVALAQALAYMAAALVLPHPVSVLLALAVGLLLTGGINERGLGAALDGTARQAWPNVGGAGAAAGMAGIAIVLLLRFETLAHLDPGWIAASLACAAAFSRGCAVLAVASLPPAAGATGPRGLDVTVAALLALLPLLALAAWLRDPVPMVVAAALAALATAAVRRALRRAMRRAGSSLQERPDASLGTVQQVSEAALLLGLLATAGVPVDEGFDAG
jgi:adenosylcobinamide-GDP ribazoletransferase